MTPRLSLSSKIWFAKNRSDDESCLVLNLLERVRLRGHSRHCHFKYGKFETELCVTLSTSHSFEFRGFERMSNLATRFSVRPSAATFIFFFLRRGKCFESASTAP